MVQIGRKGFGQVEPNFLTGIVEGKIYAKLPAAKSLGDIIENGRFAKYDRASGEVNLTGKGPWCLIYNEVTHYDEREFNAKDFALKAENFIDEIMVPRLLYIEQGDSYTTNTFGQTEGKNSKLRAARTTEGFDVEGIEVDETDLDAIVLAVDKTTGYLVLADDENADEEGPQFGVEKVYTMPDGQPGLKIYRFA